MRVHIDHVRDHFIMISNNDPASKNFNLLTLSDGNLDLSYEDRESAWSYLLKDDDNIVINEFDCFKDFIAVYATKQNRPCVLVQDLESREFKTLTVGNNDIGRIEPMLNQEYD